MDLAARLASLVGARAVTEVGGGHQARVFEATGDGGRVAVKAVAAALVDRTEHEARIEVVARLAAVDPRVCAPRPIAGRLVTEVGMGADTVLVTVSDWAEGRALDAGDARDGERMGRSLATLHASMRAIDATALPPIAALRAAPADLGLGDQLLHGDYGHGNLRLDGDVVRVFDLDDCGRGPALFDVANAIHMARFAADQTGPRPHADTFERSLLAGYAAGTGVTLDHEVVRRLVELRLRALLVWLDDLDRAPIGIRTASPAWHAVLRRYAEAHLPG